MLADGPRECLWERAFAGVALGSANVGPEENKQVR